MSIGRDYTDSIQSQEFNSSETEKTKLTEKQINTFKKDLDSLIQELAAFLDSIATNVKNLLNNPKLTKEDYARDLKAIQEEMTQFIGQIQQKMNDALQPHIDSDALRAKVEAFVMDICDQARHSKGVEGLLQKLEQKGKTTVFDLATQAGATAAGTAGTTATGGLGATQTPETVSPLGTDNPFYQAALESTKEKIAFFSIISMMASQMHANVPSGLNAALFGTPNSIFQNGPGRHINIDGYHPDQTVPADGPAIGTADWWQALVDGRVDPNFSANVNEGDYMIKNQGHGLSFSQSEHFTTQVTDGQVSYIQDPATYSVMAGAREDLVSPPQIIRHSDNSVTLEYKMRDGKGKVDIPIVRGSPYMTYQYHNATPYINSSPLPIDISTLHGYSYKRVVADGSVKDPKTEIGQSEAKALGLDDTLGAEDLVENSDPFTGQVFTYQMQGAGTQPGDTYTLYFPKETTLKPCHYEYDGDKQTDTYQTGGIVTGLTATEPMDGTVRVAKVPSHANTRGGSSLMDLVLQKMRSILADPKIPVPNQMGFMHDWAYGLLQSTNFLQTYSQLTPEDFTNFCKYTGLTVSEAEKVIANTWLQRVQPQSPDWSGIANKLNDLCTIGDTAAVQQWIQNVISGKDPVFSPMYQKLSLENQKFMQLMGSFGPATFPAQTSLSGAIAAVEGIRKAHAPDAATQAIQLFNKDAWAVPVSSSYMCDGMGRWSYHYEIDLTVSPYPGYDHSRDTPLIGILNPDSSHLDGTHLASDILYVDTIKGPLKFVEATLEEGITARVGFRDPQAHVEIPDADLASLSPDAQVKLADALMQEIPNLMIFDRGTSTLLQAQETEKASEILHALWQLAQSNPAIQQRTISTGGANYSFSSLFNHALHIVESSLDDFLIGGLLEYDQTTGMIISHLGQGSEGADDNNALGENHLLAYGNIIQAAALLRDVEQSPLSGISFRYFNDPQLGQQRSAMVGALVKDIFNTDPDDTHFPQMRECDAFTGEVRNGGWQTPSPDGMQQQATAAYYQALQGIAFWGHVTEDPSLENSAATMAQRLKNAAQAFYEPGSAASIYSKTSNPFASDAAQSFADQVLFCGLSWDLRTTTQNIETQPGEDPMLVTLAAYASGEMNITDPATLKKMYDYLMTPINGMLRIFQANIDFNLAGRGPVSLETVKLIPLIAQYSPNAASQILEWYRQANLNNPALYPFPPNESYATLLTVISEIRMSDPVLGKITIPPLPNKDPNAPTDLQKLISQIGYFININPEGLSNDGINLLKKLNEEYGAVARTITTPEQLRDWVLSTFVPKYLKEFTLTASDLYRFCALAQIDPLELPQKTVDTPYPPHPAPAPVPWPSGTPAPAPYPDPKTSFYNTGSTDISTIRDELKTIINYNYVSPGAKGLVQALYDQISTLWDKIKGGKLSDYIDDLNKMIQEDSAGNDIYRHYPGMTDIDFKIIHSALSDQTCSLTFVKMTDFDHKLVDILNIGSPGSFAFFQLLSSRYNSQATMADIKREALAFSLTGGFQDMDAQAKASFAAITGITTVPIWNYLDIVKSYCTDHNLNVGSLFDALIDQAKAQGLDKQATFSDFAGFFNSAFSSLNEGVDIFLYTNVSPEALQTLNTAFFQGKLKVPQVTEMDKMITALTQLTVDPNGKDLYAEVMNMLRHLGGTADPAALQSFLRDLYFKQDLSFMHAPLSFQIQILNASDYSFPQMVSDQVKELAKGNPRLQGLADALAQALQGVPGGSTFTFDRLNGALADFFNSKGIKDDLYIRFPEITKADLQQINQLFGGRFSMPDSTPTDQLFQAASRELQTYKPPSQDATPFTLLCKKIQELGSNAPISQLQVFAGDFYFNLQSEYNLSPSAINDFAFITHVNKTSYMDNFIDALKNFFSSQPQLDAGNFLEKILQSIQAKGEGKVTLSPLVFNIFNSFIGTTQNGMDIYATTGVSQEALQALNTTFFQGQLKIPQETEMDRIIINYQRLKVDPQGKGLYDKILEKLQQLGSGSNPQDGLAKAALFRTYLTNLYFNKDPTFTNAPFYFQKLIFNADGYSFDQMFVDKTNALAAANPKLQGVLKEMIQYAQNIGGLSFSFDALYANLSGYLNTPEQNQDVFMRFPGITKDDLEAINQLFGGNLKVPDPTPIDAAYLSAWQKLQSYTPQTDDWTVFSILCENIRQMGSQAPLSQLQGYAQDFFDTQRSRFPNMNIKDYAAVTHIVLPAVDMDAVMEDALKKIAYNNPNLSGYGYQLVQDILADLKQYEGKFLNLKDLLNHITQDVLSVQGSKDMYLRYPGLTAGDLDIIKKALSDPSQPGVALQLPPKTKMDDMFLKLLDWINNPLPGENTADLSLKYALRDEIQSLGSNGTLDQLQVWVNQQKAIPYVINYLSDPVRAKLKDLTGLDFSKP